MLQVYLSPQETDKLVTDVAKLKVHGYFSWTETGSRFGIATGDTPNYPTMTAAAAAAALLYHGSRQCFLYTASQIEKATFNLMITLSRMDQF